MIELVKFWVGLKTLDEIASPAQGFAIIVSAMARRSKFLLRSLPLSRLFGRSDGSAFQKIADTPHSASTLNQDNLKTFIVISLRD
jgi:hypothetical protein